MENNFYSMKELTQEEIRDEVLSLFEEKETHLTAVVSDLEKIEEEGVMMFEKKVLGAKNRIVQDQAVSDDDLERVYLEEVENIRKEVLEKVKHQIQDIVEKNTKEPTI